MRRGQDHVATTVPVEALPVTVTGTCPPARPLLLLIFLRSLLLAPEAFVPVSPRARAAAIANCWLPLPICHSITFRGEEEGARCFAWEACFLV
jgi:hypothetical protein